MRVAACREERSAGRARARWRATREPGKRLSTREIDYMRRKKLQIFAKSYEAKSPPEGDHTRHPQRSSLAIPIRCDLIQFDTGTTGIEQVADASAHAIGLMVNDAGELQHLDRVEVTCFAEHRGHRALDRRERRAQRLAPNRMRWFTFELKRREARRPSSARNALARVAKSTQRRSKRATTPGAATSSALTGRSDAPCDSRPRAR